MGIKLKTRKPTGIVPWPLILVEGDEGAGKTYSAAEFSASKRIGQMYWIDLAEGSADEYAAIPGAKYLIIDHDGSYRDILEQIRAVYLEARRAAAAGEPPVVLSVDSGSSLWRMLKSWTNERARRSKSNAQRLQDDPDSSIDVGMNLWNDATERWLDVIHLLQTFPGIAIITARGKQITAIDDNGKPVTDNRGRVLKEWKVQAQKDLAFDSSVWVRMRRGRARRSSRPARFSCALRTASRWICRTSPSMTWSSTGSAARWSPSPARCPPWSETGCRRG